MMPPIRFRTNRVAGNSTLCGRKLETTWCSTRSMTAVRLSTVRALDRLLVFDKGKIVEEGDHQALIRLNDGIYRRLFERQALELTKGLVA